MDIEKLKYEAQNKALHIAAKYMRSWGIRITEIFVSAKTLKNGNRAIVSLATPISYIQCCMLVRFLCTNFEIITKVIIKYFE